MTEKNLIKIITALVFVIVIGTPLFYFKFGVYPYTLAKILFFQAAVEILFFLWLSLAIASPKYRPKATPLLVGGLVFLAVYFVASLNGVDFWRSFWSTYERGIGLFALLHFAAFGLVVSSLGRELPLKKIFYSSIAASIAVDLIAYAQIYAPNLLLVESPGSRPGATFGNPTFMTNYLIFNTFLAVYLFFKEFKNRPEARSGLLVFLSAGAAILNIWTIFFLQTRGDILGLVFGITVLLLIFAIRPPQEAPGFLKKRKTYAVSLALIIFASATFFFTRENTFWEKVPTLARFQNISLSDYGALGPRISALKAGWEGFLEKPVLGWGPGNFTVVYDRHYDPKALEFSYAETHFDKTHNLLLEYADAGGMFLLLALFVFFGAIFYEAFRQKDSLWQATFVASFTAFAVSQLFFFETIGSLMMLALFLGATNGSFWEKTDDVFRENKQFSSENNFVPVALVGTFFAVSLIPVYAVNIQSLTASYHQYNGFQNFLSQNIFSGIRSFENSANIWSPYSWNFKRDYAIAVTGQYFNYPGTVQDEDALRAVKAMEEVRDEHPADAFNHYALVNLYNEVAGIDKEKFTKKAEEEARKALEISPDRQEAYFYLAKTKTIEGDYDGALSILKGVLEKNPRVPDAHFYYGLLAFATGDSQNGYKAIKTAMDMGRGWKTFYEPRAVAGFFADSDRLKEAIELYKIAWDISGQSDIETEIKLGIAYFYDKNYDQAKKYLQDAAKKFDISKSRLYEQLKPVFDELGIE